MVIPLINALIAHYPNNGIFNFNYGPMGTAHRRLKAASSNVPNTVGLYFIYAPNPWLNNPGLTENIAGVAHCLVYVGKAGMNQNGIITIHQGIQGRMLNVGAGNIRRSAIWTQEMINHGVGYLCFKWIETTNSAMVCGYDNSFWIEKAFYNLWKANPSLKPALNA
jgi:hypothetical protein